MRVNRYFIIAFLVILVDQASKLLIHENLMIHQEVSVLGEWFKLHYLLNPGMAFGIRWENEFGKLALTFFRILAMIGIGLYLFRSAHKNAHSGFLVCLSLILGGAVGNGSFDGDESSWVCRLQVRAIQAFAPGPSSLTQMTVKESVLEL